MTTAVSEQIEAPDSRKHPLDLVRTDVVCELFSITPFQLYGLIKTTDIPAVKLGNEYRFDYEEVVAWWEEEKRRQIEARRGKNNR